MQHRWNSQQAKLVAEHPLWLAIITAHLTLEKNLMKRVSFSFHRSLFKEASLLLESYNPPCPPQEGLFQIWGGICTIDFNIHTEESALKQQMLFMMNAVVTLSLWGLGGSPRHSTPRTGRLDTGNPKIQNSIIEQFTNNLKTSGYLTFQNAATFMFKLGNCSTHLKSSGQMN